MMDQYGSDGHCLARVPTFSRIKHSNRSPPEVLFGDLYIGGSGVARGYMADRRFRRPSDSRPTHTVSQEHESTRQETLPAGVREVCSSCWGEGTGR